MVVLRGNAIFDAYGDLQLYGSWKQMLEYVLFIDMCICDVILYAYVYVYVYMYIYVYIYKHTYIYIYAYIRIYVCMYMYICMNTSTYR